MTSNQLYSIISNVLKIPLSEINDETNSASIESWDSFMGYVLLDEIENTFNVKFSLDESIEIKSVNDFKKLLTKNIILL